MLYITYDQVGCCGTVSSFQFLYHKPGTYQDVADLSNIHQHHNQILPTPCDIVTAASLYVLFCHAYA